MPSAAPQTFLFADIAGFTALTEAHGDEHAAELAGAFCRRTAELVEQVGGEVVKTIGDAVMARVPEPAAAVELGIAVACEELAGHELPTIRVGMHHGTAVASGGDWLGATVNLAARVAGVARGGEALLTDAVRAAAGPLGGIELRDRGTQRVRNVSAPVRLWAAERAGRKRLAWPIDPVCRMAVEPGREAGELEYGGERHVFCSLECAARFARSPEAFAAPL